MDMSHRHDSERARSFGFSERFLFALEQARPDCFFRELTSGDAQTVASEFGMVFACIA